jgi:hypothetical protein
MTYTIDADYSNGVSDLINHPIVTYSDAPVFITSNEFTTTRRPRPLDVRAIIDSLTRR